MMRTVFPAVREALLRGERAVLCGILASSGSTPRGPGARMAVFAGGGAAGTIGGGAVERLAQEQALGMLREAAPLVRTFQLHPNGGENIGMICGGEVTVAFQPLGREDLPLVERVCALLEEGQAAWLVTELSREGRWPMGLWTEDGPWGADLSVERVRPLLGRRAVLEESGGAALFVEPLAREGTVYVFGAGHVGLELAWVLDRAGFRVAVLDDRPEALSAGRFPPGVQCVQVDFSHIGISLAAEDYVVVMTAGHGADLTVLEQVLPMPVTYIGCIGSKKKAAATRERLKEKGFTEIDIKRIFSPIGLPIGGETPAEIAISIAAQLIAHRAGREAGNG